MRLKSIVNQRLQAVHKFDCSGRINEAVRRLIILAGPNGSGKSSFLDALHLRGTSWTSRKHPITGKRTITLRLDVAWSEAQWDTNVMPLVEFHGAPSLKVTKKTFFVHSIGIQKRS